MPYYAVAVGRVPGIYLEWDECLIQVHGFFGAVYKKFRTYEDASKFIDSKKSTTQQNMPLIRHSDSSITSSLYNNYQEVKVQISNNHITGGIPVPGGFYVPGGYYVPSSIKGVNIQAPESPRIVPGGYYLPSNNRMPSVNPLCSIASSGTSQASVRNSLDKTTENFPNRTIVYTDGSWLNNGHVKAAGIGVWFGKEDPRNISEQLPKEFDPPNSQKAELYAAVRALELVSGVIEIRTDSMYLIKAMMKWRWGWITSTGQWVREVKNKDLFNRLFSLTEGRDVKWKYVPAHSGIEGNEEADRLAVVAASAGFNSEQLYYKY